ncbi:MAG: hypothetical protein H6773_01065 [Pseudomonadales bacterium]|nr:hypothetical protein [Pseudomonadales bacterium]
MELKNGENQVFLEIGPDLIYSAVPVEFTSTSRPFPFWKKYITKEVVFCRRYCQPIFLVNAVMAYQLRELLTPLFTKNCNLHLPGTIGQSFVIGTARWNHAVYDVHITFKGFNPEQPKERAACYAVYQVHFDQH